MLDIKSLLYFKNKIICKLLDSNLVIFIIVLHNNYVINHETNLKQPWSSLQQWASCEQPYCRQLMSQNQVWWCLAKPCCRPCFICSNHEWHWAVIKLANHWIWLAYHWRITRQLIISFQLTRLFWVKRLIFRTVHLDRWK